MDATETLWVRAAHDEPRTIEEETAALGACFASAEDAGVGDTGVLRVVVRGPLPAGHEGIPLRLYAARIFNEFGCDVWAIQPAECSCCGGSDGCDLCRDGLETSTGRPGVLTPSLDEAFFYPNGGGA